MSAGHVTKLHLDTFAVGSKHMYLPAAGTIRAVRRDHEGPTKRAIVVCARDKEKVASKFRLDVRKLPNFQYTGKKVDLEGLATLLRAEEIRFVVMEFPSECSYILPSGCAHMFVTLGLFESSTWFTSLKVDVPEAVDSVK